MSNRVGTLNKNINYISPTYLRPTKEMLEKYENIWLPLRKKIKDEKKRNKNFFLLYGDFDILEIKNKTNSKGNINSSKKKITNPKSNNNSSKKNRSNSSTKKKQTQVIKGKKRTWTIRDK